MHERNGTDEREEGSSPAVRSDRVPGRVAPGRESLAWIRALANAWEDDRHTELPDGAAGHPPAPPRQRSQ